MGNSSPPVSTTIPGIVPVLPTASPTKVFFRGDGTYQQANYPDLANIPSVFPPATHGTQHVSTGNDAVPLATASATGLMPARSGAAGTYLDVTGAWSVPGVGTVTTFVGTTGATFVIPAAGTTGVAITLSATITDLVNGMAILITDGTREATFLTTTVSGTAVTATCTGTTSSGATMANGAHIYFALAKHGSSHVGGGSDAIPAATTSVPGLVQPDGTSISVTPGGIISLIGAPGVGTHGARVSNTANQTPTNTVGLSFGTNAAPGCFDVGGFWASGTPTVLTVPAGQAGYYVCGGSVMWSSAATGGSYRSLQLMWNLSANINNYFAVVSDGPVRANNSGNHQTVSGIYKFAVGDTLSLLAATDQTNPSIVYVGATLPALWMFRIA